MKNILSFEELFLENYKRTPGKMELLSNGIDKMINDSIYEKYGISSSVIHIVKLLVEQIESCIEDGEFAQFSLDLDPLSFIKSDMVGDAECFELEQMFNVKNLVFDTRCVLMNYKGLSEEEFDEVSALNIIAHMKPRSSNVFELICYIPVLDFKINKRMIGVLNHEIMHTWQYHKKNSDGKKEKTYPEWKKIYGNSMNIIQGENEDDDVKTVAKAVYASDLRELASFTQQAYIDLRDETDYHIVDKKIKETDLYKNMNNLKNGLDFIEKNGVPEELDVMDNKKMVHIFKKRLESYADNISRVVMARKSVIEDSNEYMDASPREMMLIY